MLRLMEDGEEKMLNKSIELEMGKLRRRGVNTLSRDRSASTSHG